MNRVVRVFLVFVLVGSVLVVPAGSVGATHDHRYHLSATASLAQGEDGGWVVLETDLDSDGGWIYRYSSDWEERDHHRLLLDGNRQFQPFGIEPARGGGWWVIDQEGRIHRFSESWEYANETHRIPHPMTSSRFVGDGFDLTRAPDGGWWIAADRKLAYYTANFTRPNGTVDTVDGVSSGYPVATRIDDGSLLVLEGYLGKGLARYALTANGSRMAASSTERRESAWGQITVAVPSETLLAPGRANPTDFVRTGDGWLLLYADGTVTRPGQDFGATTGTISVGSDSVEGTYPSDNVGPGPTSGGWLGFGLVGGLLGIVLVGAVLGTAFVWRRWSRDENRIDRSE